MHMYILEIPTYVYPLLQRIQTNNTTMPPSTKPCTLISLIDIPTPSQKPPD